MKKYETALAGWRKKPFIARLIQAFPKAEIFLVGGMVRDAIIGRDTKDIDLVVRGVSKKNLEKFLSTQGSVSLVGKRFGVFKFKPKGSTEREIDIALPRTEHSINHTGAYKDFKVQTDAHLSIEEDLSRRDFTINAMAWDLRKQTLVDPFNGKADILKKRIKTVGKPEHRFTEDYSRMLRAIRFSCQLGFTIDPATKRAITKEIKKLTKLIAGKPVVPYEVIAAELYKMMAADPIKAMALLDTTGALAVLMPELLKMKKCPQPKIWHQEGDVWKHTMMALAALKSPAFKKEFKQNAPAEVIWAVLFHDVGKPYTITRADRIRFSGHDVKSAKIWRETAERLKLAASGLAVDDIETLAAKHMLIASAKHNPMKHTTLERYFYNKNFPGMALLMVMFADLSATIYQKTGRAHFDDYKTLKRRIAALKPRGSTTPPKQLITGTDLIRQLKLTESPKIGKLLDIVREAQLAGTVKTKQQALQLAKKSL